jgi:peroxiredoxin Q/BCP
MNEWNTTLLANLSSLLTVFVLATAHAAELAVGADAPAFALQDQGGKTHRLEDYRGRWVVLYFYPKDDTPGCTKEACNFRDDLPKLRALGVQILGVSVDNTESHARFATKYSLPFPLLADEGGVVAKAYDTLWSLGPIKFTKRHTFIIGPDGKIARIYRDVKPEEHSRQVLEDVKALQQPKG